MALTMQRRSFAVLLLSLILSLASAALAAQTSDTGSGYRIQTGDVIRISVWKEPDLLQDLLVRPDGNISFPLVGELGAAGRSVGEIQAEISNRINEYIPDPVVTVQIIETAGNTIYVLGKVNRPGVFVMRGPTDVTQALALAGGIATFGAESRISILRRSGGSQTAIAFDLDDVKDGRELGQNIILQPGDVVVVP